MSREARLVRAIASAFDTASLRIRYVVKKSKTRRTITPLCFQVSHKNDRLLVLAYCWEREQLRSFFIHRIAHVDPEALKPVATALLCDILFTTNQTDRYRRGYITTAAALERYGVDDHE